MSRQYLSGVQAEDRPDRAGAGLDVRSGPYPSRNGQDAVTYRLYSSSTSISLRLTDRWREAGEISEWNLDAWAAFMRAAYGKGYCDALH